MRPASVISPLFPLDVSPRSSPGLAPFPVRQTHAGTPCPPPLFPRATLRGGRRRWRRRPRRSISTGRHQLTAPRLPSCGGVVVCQIGRGGFLCVRPGRCYPHAVRTGSPRRTRGTDPLRVAVHCLASDECAPASRTRTNPGRGNAGPSESCGVLPWSADRPPLTGACPRRIETRIAAS